MKDDAEETQSSRRGFFRALFSDVGADAAREKTERKVGASHASVMALKYAKHQLHLSKIGVESPTFLRENLYSVKLSGQEDSGETLDLEFEVNAETGAIKRFGEEPEDD